MGRLSVKQKNLSFTTWEEEHTEKNIKKQRNGILKKYLLKTSKCKTLFTGTRYIYTYTFRTRLKLDKKKKKPEETYI